jgi:hypothetical protein
MILLAWVRTTDGGPPCFTSLIICALCVGTAPCCWIVDIHHVRIDGRPWQTGFGYPSRMADTSVCCLFCRA